MGLFGLLEPDVEKLKARRDVDGLLRALARAGKNEQLGLAAARALAELKAARAVDALVPWLQRGELRPAAAEALGAIGDLRAVEPLLRSLLFAPEPPPGGPVTAALRAFGTAGSDAIAALLAGSDEALQLAAARALGNLADARAVVPLVAALERNPPWNTGTTIVAALVRIGPPATPSVAPLVLRPDCPAQAQRWAIECLAESGDPRGAEVLAQLLESAPGPVRHPAVRALRQLQWQPANLRQQVLLAAYGGGDWDAVAALGTPARDVVLELAEAMPEARSNIFRTLTRIDPDWFLTAPPAAVAPLLEAALATGTDTARAEARAALPALLAAAPRELLREVMKAKEPEVRRAAVGALARHGAAAVPTLVTALADQDDFVRDNAAAQLAGIGEPAVDALIAGLAGRGAIPAARVLGRIGTARAIKPLATALRGGRESALAWVAGEVLAGFGTAGARELIAALEPRRGRPDNEAAAAALGRTGAPEAVGPLVALLVRASDLGCVVKAEASLWQILRAVPEQLTDDDLRAVAGLADRTLSVHSTSDHSWDHGRYDDHKHRFGALRDWANEELARRCQET
ncbi:MAG: HEAT repeat domain-containing protein [Gemmatimonadetes bacterium]|nr:HEAT repeat domain-containing protein [Gemmatimonadota bacterium]